MSNDKVCKCKRGYVSVWDDKCGHCRTRKEREALEKQQKEFFKKHKALEDASHTVVGFSRGQQ